MSLDIPLPSNGDFEAPKVFCQVGDTFIEVQFVALELNIAAFPALAPRYKAALFRFSIFTEPFLVRQSG